MALKTVFLDLDGVLVDHAKLGPEYVRLLGDVIAPELGGEPSDWGRANAATFPALFDRLMNDLDPSTPPTDAYRLEYVENVRGMCEWLGRVAPDEAECERLGRRMNVYVRGNSRAVFPAAAGAVRDLSRRRVVHLATGNPSWNAEAQLRQMGVWGLIGLPCGPDLVGVMKRSPAFYPRLFERAGISGPEAVVVDDSRDQLVLAAAVGARTVLVTKDAEVGPHVDAVVAGVEHLSSAIESFL